MSEKLENEKDIKKVDINDLSFEQEKNFIYIKWNKNFVIAESEKNILLKLQKFGVWFPKKFVYSSPYTNLLNLSVMSDYNYGFIDNIDNKDNDNLKYITGDDFISLVNKLKGIK